MSVNAMDRITPARRRTRQSSICVVAPLWPVAIVLFVDGSKPNNCVLLVVAVLLFLQEGPPPDG